VAAASYTGADFDLLSFHDCHVHAVELLTGDPGQDDWTSGIALDIDYIARWACSTDGSARFHLAPATLSFEAVTDLQVQIDWGRSGHQVALHPAAIDRIEREQVTGQKIHLDRPYYSWTISLNWPEGGLIRFGAVGFTLQLRSEPTEAATQHLSTAQRR